MPPILHLHFSFISPLALSSSRRLFLCSRHNHNNSSSSLAYAFKRPTSSGRRGFATRHLTLYAPMPAPSFPRLYDKQPLISPPPSHRTTSRPDLQQRTLSTIPILTVHYGECRTACWLPFSSAQYQDRMPPPISTHVMTQQALALQSPLRCLLS